MAQLIRGTMLLAQHQEQLLFADCFGKTQMVYLGLLAGPTRADKIASTVASMTAAEDSIKAYAATNNIDITADLAAGAAAIAAMLAEG